MNRYLYILFLLWIVTACSDDITDIDTSLEEIRVEANIGVNATMRAVGNTWNNADQIGVSGSGKGNVLYSTTSSTTSATFTSISPIYYTSPASYYDAYYPYQASPTTNTNASTEFSVTTGPTQNASENSRKAIDVMWAKTSSTVSTGTNVVFNFTHQLAQLVITFDWSGTGFASAPASWDFTIGSVKQSATVNITHSQYTTSWSAPSCTVTPSTSASDYTVTGWNSTSYTMIIPAQDLSSKPFKVKVNGITYSGTLPASFNLTQGTTSTVTIKVNKTELEATSSVSDWGNGTETNSTPINATL